MQVLSSRQRTEGQAITVSGVIRPFGRFPIEKSDKVHKRNGNRLARGRQPLKRTEMRPGHGRAEGDDLPLRQQLVNLEVQVGEGSAQHGDHRFQMRGKVGSRRLLVVYRAWSVRFIDDDEVSFII